MKEDQPLIAGPMQKSVPVCLGCYEVLNKNIAVPCRRCGWPLCQNCKDHGPECHFTSSRRDDKVNIIFSKCVHKFVLLVVSLFHSEDMFGPWFYIHDDHCTQLCFKAW